MTSNTNNSSNTIDGSSDPTNESDAIASVSNHKNREFGQEAQTDSGTEWCLTPLYENDDILAISKPSGWSCFENYGKKILSRADESVQDLMPRMNHKFDCQLTMTFPLHREYSGIVVFSKNLNTHEYLTKKYMKYCQAQKILWQTFRAVAAGKPDKAFGKEQVHISRVLTKSNMWLSVCTPTSSTGSSASKKGKMIRPLMSYNTISYNKELDVSHLEIETNGSKWESIQAYLCYLKCPAMVDDVYGSLCTTFMGKTTLVPVDRYDKDKALEYPKRLKKLVKTIKPHEQRLFIHRSSMTLSLRKSTVKIEAPLWSTMNKFVHLWKIAGK